MNREFIEALDELEKEKGIPKDDICEMIEQALISAYKKNYDPDQNVRVVMDRETGDIAVLLSREVVCDEDFFDEGLEIPLSEAREIDGRYEIGDQIEFSVMPEDFGRIAAQAVKQVVMQRLRETERGMIYDEFSQKQGEIITGTVQRKRGRTIYVVLGRTEGILTAKEQVPTEHFNVRDRLKVYIMDVKNSTKGPQVFLSRSHPGLIKGLFQLEVPEIQDGTVEIVSIAREAGSRTKMAVYSNDENVDPVGACVGTRGVRVQAVVDEVSGEKIDIIPWSENPEELIANVLSPAEVEAVYIDDYDERLATAVVPDYQLSLAIGKQGQNVRLAAKVSGWKIDIKSHTQFEEVEDAYEEELMEEDTSVSQEAQPDVQDVAADPLNEQDVQDETSATSEELQ
ncbi:MAG: transcription termination factor NusA [Eubacteriales bacterium]|nr:transcription termination factor NusA [Eubacteriales bacterium]